MREGKKADIDMIAQLPDPILQHILLFLPTADAARMSIVSKYWLNLRNSLSFFHFSSKNTHTLQDFLPLLDDSLSTLRSPQQKPIIIHSFVLDLSLATKRRNPLDTVGVLHNSAVAGINDRISLVLKFGVRHFKLIFAEVYYRLPLSIFSAKSLLSLHVENCFIWREPFFLVPHDCAPFDCLKELTLLKVHASSYLIEKILSYTPLLEKVVLKEISNVGSLKICNLPRLHYVEVEQTFEGRLVIEAPSLRTLILQLRGSGKVHVSDCITRYGNYRSKYAFEHPSLESLHLCFYSCVRLKVVCSHLRFMSLLTKGSGKPLMVYVDAQKLEQLNYEGYVIPYFYGKTSEVKPSGTLKLLLGGRPGLDVAVRTCIDMFNQPTLHLSYLYGQFFKAQEILWPGQVQQVEVNSPPPKVKCLIWSLSSNTPTSAYPNLLDGSLCSCHPLILRVETLAGNREFIKFLCHELFNRDENRSCCEDEPEYKCWRHYLKGVTVTVEIQSQSETEKPKTFRGNTSMEVLKYVDTAKEFQFSMNWLLDPFFLCLVTATSR